MSNDDKAIALRCQRFRERPTHESRPRASSHTHAYAGVAVPTLLMRATETTLAASRVVDLLHSTLPNHELVEIGGAGHMSPVTHPEPVNDAIEAHLDRQTVNALMRFGAIAGARPLPLTAGQSG